MLADVNNWTEYYFIIDRYCIYFVPIDHISTLYFAGKTKVKGMNRADEPSLVKPACDL